MKAYVFKTVGGVFAFDERGNVILREEFPKDPQLIAEKMVKICEEEKKILERLINSPNFEPKPETEERNFFDRVKDMF